MITRFELKKIREENGLKQSELARLLNVDASMISKYESGARGIDIEFLNRIADCLGYELELELVDKEKLVGVHNRQFYWDKTPVQIMKLSLEDRIDYIFVKCDISIVSKICNIDEYVLSKMSLKDLKEMVSDAVKCKSEEVLFHILNRTYEGYPEEYIVPFAKACFDYINTCNGIDENDIDKIYYFKFNNEWFEEENRWSLCPKEVLDKDGNFLMYYGCDINSGNGLIEEYLCNYLSSDLGKLIEGEHILYIRPDDFENAPID